MNASIDSARIYTDFEGLSRLKAEARRQSPEARREVARQFEALFLQLMLKSMRQASDALGGTDSEQLRFYRQMFDQQVALELAGSRGLGLAEVFERQLRAGDGAARRMQGGMEVPGRRPFPERAATAVEEAALGPFTESDWPPAGPEEFVRALWPAAEQAAARLGADPEVILAQAALESGWGRHTPRDARGDSHNLFGIKADGSWRGERVSRPTLEYRDGVAVRERAEFRSYGSPLESLQDYVSFLRGNPRYRPALERAGEGIGFVRALQEAGYATDPAYAEKVERILRSDAFADAVARARSAG